MHSLCYGFPQEGKESRLKEDDDRDDVKDIVIAICDTVQKLGEQPMPEEEDAKETNKIVVTSSMDKTPTKEWEAENVASAEKEDISTHLEGNGKIQEMEETCNEPVVDYKQMKIEVISVNCEEDEDSFVDSRDFYDAVDMETEDMSVNTTTDTAEMEEVTMDPVVEAALPTIMTEESNTISKKICMVDVVENEIAATSYVDDEKDEDFDIVTVHPYCVQPDEEVVSTGEAATEATYASNMEEEQSVEPWIPMDPTMEGSQYHDHNYTMLASSGVAEKGECSDPPEEDISLCGEDNLEAVYPEEIVTQSQTFMKDTSEGPCEPTVFLMEGDEHNNDAFSSSPAKTYEILVNSNHLLGNEVGRLNDELALTRLQVQQGRQEIAKKNEQLSDAAGIMVEQQKKLSRAEAAEQELKEVRIQLEKEREEKATAQGHCENLKAAMEKVSNEFCEFFTELQAHFKKCCHVKERNDDIRQKMEERLGALSDYVQDKHNTWTEQQMEMQGELGKTKEMIEALTQVMLKDSSHDADESEVPDEATPIIVSVTSTQDDIKREIDPIDGTDEILAPVVSSDQVFEEVPLMLEPHQEDKLKRCRLNNGLYYCVCGLSFRSGSLLGVHLRNVTVPGDFQCLHCDQRFDLLNLLRVHMDSCHSGRGPLKIGKRAVACNVCGKTYANKGVFAALHSNAHPEHTEGKSNSSNDLNITEVADPLPIKIELSDSDDDIVEIPPPSPPQSEIYHVKTEPITPVPLSRVALLFSRTNSPEPVARVPSCPSPKKPKLSVDTRPCPLSVKRKRSSLLPTTPSPGRSNSSLSPAVAGTSKELTKRNSPSDKSPTKQSKDHGFNRSKQHLGFYCTCGVNFISRRGLDKHIQVQLSLKKEDFSSEEAPIPVAEAVILESYPILKTDANEEPEFSRRVSHHRPCLTNALTCICGYSSKYMSIMRKHYGNGDRRRIAGKVVPDETGKFQFQCSLCPKIFARACELGNHMKRTHNNVKTPNASGSSPGKNFKSGRDDEDVAVASSSSKPTHSEGMDETPLSSPHGICPTNPLNCICGYTSYYKASINNHLKYHATPRSQRGLAAKRKVFKRNGRHRAITHKTSNRPEVSNVGNSTWAPSYPVIVPDVVDDGASSSTFKQTNPKREEKIGTIKAVHRPCFTNPLKCICGYTTTFKSWMERHCGSTKVWRDKRSGSKGAPVIKNGYHCSVCPKMYHRGCDLANHMRRSHQKSYLPAVASQVLNPQGRRDEASRSKIERIEGPFAAVKPLKTFKRRKRGNPRKSFKTNHRPCDTNPQRCICGYTAKYASQIRHHVDYHRGLISKSNKSKSARDDGAGRSSATPPTASNVLNVAPSGAGVPPSGEYIGAPSSSTRQLSPRKEVTEPRSIKVYHRPCLNNPLKCICGFDGKFVSRMRNHLEYHKLRQGIAKGKGRGSATTTYKVGSPPATSEAIKILLKKQSSSKATATSSTSPSTSVAVTTASLGARSSFGRKVVHAIDYSKRQVGHYCTCGKGYNSLRTLQCHVAYNSNVVCPQCPSAQFHSNYYLRLHMATAHNAVIWRRPRRPIQIPVNDSKKHRAILSSDPNHWECSCGKQYTTQMGLKNHVRERTQGQIHQCSVCHRKFYQRSQLKTHLALVHQTQMNEDVAICRDCGVCFKTRGECLLHRRLVHRQGNC